MKSRLSWRNEGSEKPLVDVVVGLVLSSVLLALTGMLWLYGSRDLAATAHYGKVHATTYDTLGFKTRKLPPAPRVAGSQCAASTLGPASITLVAADAQKAQGPAVFVP